jgi:phage recombination protein Bet
MEQNLATQQSALGKIEVTAEQVDLVKTTVFPGASDDELKLYFFECRRRGVHPLDRLVIPVKRKDKNEGYKISFQTSIDLFRSQAEETGEYRGQKDIEYGDMLAWPGVDKKVPSSAKATVLRHDSITGETIEVSATAYWEEYYPGEQLGFQWRKMPRLMLGKCAEALALRKAFPRKLAGLYTFEEMQLTDLITQGKKYKQPQSKSGQQTEAPPDAEGDLTVKEKLDKELREYCTDAEGLVDMNLYKSVLKEVSTWKEHSFDEITEKISDKWAGSALGKLRDKTRVKDA